MKIDVVSYLQSALKHVTSQPVDLSAVHVDISMEFQPDDIDGKYRMVTTLTAAEDAGAQFREALRHAGMDDLRVFELGRAFDRLLEGLSCT